jgi:hypothetical protein
MSTVTIKDPTRNADQNALMWELIGQIRKHPGNERPHWSAEAWKCGMMALCGHEIQWDRGLGDTGPLPLGFRSSQLTVPQMAALITTIFKYGAEQEVVFTENPRRGIFWTEKDKEQ